MTTIYAKPNEHIDALLRRFKKAVERSGLLAELKKREYYEKPSVKRKRKKAAARKRALKKEKIAARNNRGSGANFRFNKDKTEKIYMTNRPNNNYKGNRNNRPNRNQPNTKHRTQK